MRAALTRLGEFGHQVERGAVGDGLLERLEPSNDAIERFEPSDDVIERLEESFEVVDAGGALAAPIGRCRTPGDRRISRDRC
jgi:hypothetical protein